jgi:hypothetical protein
MFWSGNSLGPGGWSSFTVQLLSGRDDTPETWLFA